MYDAGPRIVVVGGAIECTTPHTFVVTHPHTSAETADCIKTLLETTNSNSVREALVPMLVNGFIVPVYVSRSYHVLVSARVGLSVDVFSLSLSLPLSCVQLCRAVEEDRPEGA
jgi:hypothetical protein